MFSFSRWRRHARRALNTCALTAGLILPTALASQSIAPLRVFNDPGGSLPHRVQEVARLRSSGRPVEIRSGYCNSACTLYLGLPSTCIGRQASFGFHGPSSSRYGIALPPRQFNYWSTVMADHYPEPLRGWFMREGRQRVVGLYRITGAELIRLGVRECA